MDVGYCEHPTCADGDRPATNRRGDAFFCDDHICEPEISDLLRRDVEARAAAMRAVEAWNRLATWNHENGFDRDYLPRFLHTAMDRLARLVGRED